MKSASNAEDTQEKDVIKELKDKSSENENKDSKTSNEKGDESKLENVETNSSNSKPENVETNSSNSIDLGEEINFIVIYGKEKIKVKLPENSTVLQLKCHLESVIGVPHKLQKIMYKGMAKDEQTLKSLQITNDTKIMMVGSKLNDLLNISAAVCNSAQADAEEKSSKEPWSRQKMHRKILDKGVPDDAMPGILNTKEPLPPFPLSGMLNKGGGKLRITFKLELDELWLGTKEKTEKIRMSSIKSVISEPIEGMEEYHILALQLGTTDASRYWIYFVPSQYVDSIKNTIGA